MSVQAPGRLLGGRYRLQREIARGGMAAVWQAQDTLLERAVALKLLHPHFADDPEFLERFRREARAAASLSHPNIVSVYDVGEDGQTRTPFIVMELVDGESLKDRIRRAAPLPDQDVREIGAAIATALEYAHRRGIIHRDVKPQNVLLGEDGRPRLTDFGIAQALASSGLTRTGAVMGSVHYLAPELIRGRPATPASDVYGLGAVLYEMATGRVPFSGETDMAVALAHVEQTPAAPRALNGHIAPDLEQAILRTLAKDPEQRFASAGELATVLRTAGAVQPTTRMPNVPPPTGVSPRPAERRASGQAPPGPIPPGRRPTADAYGRRSVGADAYRREAAAPGVVRRATRPRPRTGAGGGGVLGLLLALAAVLVALGVGFFGLASLSREGLVPVEPTATVAPAAPTPPPKPVAVPSPTSTPAPSPTPEPPSPTPVPSPTPAPPTPTPAPRATPRPRAISVPSLRGKTLDEARASLQAAGLTATFQGINVNVDKDVVADQSPEAGAQLPPGGTVAVRVGTGFTPVPDVANRPQNDAVKLLQDNSFRVTIVTARDARAPAGAAVATRPEPGTIVPRGATVELTISAGR